jgi:phospholipase/carboxylesterase
MAKLIFIILPGFTMNYEDLLPLTNKLKELYPKSKQVKVNPPYRKISIYKNAKYRAWYDYLSNNCLKEACIDTEQLIESRERIHKILLKESKHANIKNIYLVGYSQGACMALDAGLSYHHKIGGIISLKGHIPRKTYEYLNTKQRVLAAHGQKDKTIGYNVAFKSYSKLKLLEYDITILKQTCNHSLKTGLNEQLKYIKDFIKYR